MFRADQGALWYAFSRPRDSDSASKPATVLPGSDHVSTSRGGLDLTLGFDLVEFFLHALVVLAEFVEFLAKVIDLNVRG